MGQSFRTDGDILSREKFLNSLAETYLFQDAILNATELSIFSVDPEGIIVSTNPATERMLGYSSDELVRKEKPTLFLDQQELEQRAIQLTKELGEPIVAGFDCLIARVRMHKREDRKEWTYVRKDQKRLTVLLSISPIWNEQGEITSYLGIATDITDQRKAGDELRKYQQHLEALIASTDDMAFEVNRSGVYVNVWTKNEHLLFVERERYVGSSLESVLKGSLLTLFQRAIADVFETQQNQLLEYEVPGINQWRSAKISYIHSDSVLILVRDISELKRNQQLILESERKFRLLAENLPGTIYLCRNDALYSMVYLNDNVLDLTGYSPAEFIAGDISFVQLYHPDDAPSVYSLVEKALAARQKFVVSYRIKNRAGEYRWIEEHGIGVYENNELVLIEGYLIDITDQKQKELELIQSRNDIQSILISLDDLVLEIDEDGLIQKIWANRPDQLFFPVEQQLGRNIRDLLPPTLANAYLEAISNCLKSGQSFSVEYPSILEGDDRWFHARFTAIKNSILHRKCVSVLVQNITERKKFEQDLVLSKSNLETATHELQEQNNQLSEFNQILSHNLRSPVGNITALISFLNENSTLEEYRDIFQRLKDTSTNLQETLNDLMETIQINRGALAERVLLKFGETIQKVKQDLAGEIISSNARIETDFSAAEEILYSKTYLESIFLNLLSNALKYRSPKRQLIIKLKTELLGERTVLRFSDNGLGIDLTKYGHQLFGLRKTFHEHREAKGVGLFLTRTQIKAMGGQIHAESAVDQGTTFIIEF